MPVSESEARSLQVFGPEATLIRVGDQYHNLVRNSAAIGGDCRMEDVTELPSDIVARDRWAFRVFGPAGAFIGDVALRLWVPSQSEGSVLSERVVRNMAKGWAWFLGEKYVEKPRPRIREYGVLEFLITGNSEYN